ncbi:MAG: nitroreductase family protein [Campylobacterales bacterium]|nr:nitroreductase family protein [Campylobacterales bacterium]
MRETKYDIDEFFKLRYSPREFVSTQVSDEDFKAILEAASTAPSCFNVQPWRFYTADKEKFFKILSSGNISWCDKLEKFLLIACKNTFDARGDKPEKLNEWAEFDCGCAWGFMQLEANKRGYSLHAMAGFDKQKAKEVFNLGKFEPIAVIAFGKAEKAVEFTPREPLSNILFEL